MAISNDPPFHHGADFIILGAAPSIRDNLKHCPLDAIRIAVNHHHIGKFDFDYHACIDRKTPQWIRERGSDRLIIGTVPDCDMVCKPDTHPINSGIYAIYLARRMGARRIFCCGMDFYRGERDYFDSDEEVKRPNKSPGYGLKCAELAIRFAGDIELVRFSWW